jgi:hypothetical protein
VKVLFFVQAEAKTLPKMSSLKNESKNWHIFNTMFNIWKMGRGEQSSFFNRWLGTRIQLILDKGSHRLL